MGDKFPHTQTDIDAHNRGAVNTSHYTGVGRMAHHTACCIVRDVRISRYKVLHKARSVLHISQYIVSEHNEVRTVVYTNRSHLDDTVGGTDESTSRSLCRRLLDKGHDDRVCTYNRD